MFPEASGASCITGLIGHPVAHSRSPEIHHAWLAAHGIDARYVAIDVPPEQVAEAVATMRKTRVLGLNVTVPHKRAVMPHADVVDHVAQRIGAANTLYWRDGTLHATNTDAFGFIENLRAQAALETHLEHAVIMGAGGAARAVVVALLDAGATRITIANRTFATAESLCAQDPSRVTAIAWEALPDALASATLLVNTTSLGMEGQPALEVDLAPLPITALVHDIVYAPLHTELLLAAQARGNPIATGLGMLYYQAQAAFALWHGVTPEVRLP